MNAAWNTSRGLFERIVITGVLTLETPAHLGNGDSDGPLDMPILLDSLDGRALLTGTSVAGALRNYARATLGAARTNGLFGRIDGNTAFESPLIVDDCLGAKPLTELRDGVAIDPRTRTAEDAKKFDIELLEAGTTFTLGFELLVPRKQSAGSDIVRDLALALRGFEAGEIALGKRKRRGLGKCRVSTWTIRRYDMMSPVGILGWLKERPTRQASGPSILAALGVADPGPAAAPHACVLEATFALDGSLLIRSGGDRAGEPDFAHLTSKRGTRSVPIVSGTSLAGALRARALRIANTLGKNGYTWVDRLFGYRRRETTQPAAPVMKPGERRSRSRTESGKITASRLWVEECEIEKPVRPDLVQTRIKIDRFTGGVYPGALFSEQPVFGTDETRITCKLRLDSDDEGDAGLLLLLLKDLWTGDLPVGGESSVGRGRLRGIEATLTRGAERWKLEAGANPAEVRVVEGRAERLQDFVDQFVQGG